ncbi:unnamed protein product [Rotaria magnacalcarata]|nr:unnamed protein product [Rotaria magnacalcarata]CAF2065285.1 unnamed protein product [Rotaria magnacalcarata]CAF4002201.1 unnamed protein product [Rotaria magnacalcarata]CAF4161695.1 unnamed protein product [Rotaria magnacalcarata]CAF4579779.1 unnamed protein product [Rotaria magnacalcarata]
MGNTTQKHNEDYKILTNDIFKRFHLMLGFSEDFIRTEHQKFYATANNGRSKKSQIEELLHDYLPPATRKHTKQLNNSLFSAIDTNDDGYVDFGEYLMSLKFFQTESPTERADFVFRIIDKDGNNRLTKRELEHILTCLQEYHKSLNDSGVTEMTNDGPKSATERLFQKLDQDSSGDINVSEFVDGWLKDNTIRTLFTF